MKLRIAILTAIYAQAVARRLILSEQIIHLRDGKVALDYLIHSVILRKPVGPDPP